MAAAARPGCLEASSDQITFRFGGKVYSVKTCKVIIFIAVFIFLIIALVAITKVAKTDWKNYDGSYTIQKQCPFNRYFVQGLEVLSDNKTLILSSGKYVLSKLVLIDFDFESCSFTETFSKDVDSELFAEGVTIVDDKAYQLTYKNNLYLKWDMND